MADARDIPALRRTGREGYPRVCGWSAWRRRPQLPQTARGWRQAPPSAASQRRLEVIIVREIAPSLVQAVGEDAGLARQVVLAGASTLLSAGLMSPQAFEIEEAGENHRRNREPAEETQADRNRAGAKPEPQKMEGQPTRR
ncbi:hypothetical protein ACPA9J_08170 [Pseudomonas aeruginosa]